MKKPVLFISHIHDEESIANTLEEILHRALFEAIDIFNSSNRKSIAIGDPWREKIIDTLKDASCVLVLCSPDSVSSPWVNFESGGAWISGNRVIPCCVKGMKTNELTSPFSHLQAVNLSQPEGLKLLIKELAQLSNLEYSADFNFEMAATELCNSWLKNSLISRKNRKNDQSFEEAKAFMTGFLIVASLIPDYYESSIANIERINAYLKEWGINTEKHIKEYIQARDGGASVTFLAKTIGGRMSAEFKNIAPYFEAGFNILLNPTIDKIQSIVNTLNIPNDLKEQRGGELEWINDLKDHFWGIVTK